MKLTANYTHCCLILFMQQTDSALEEDRQVGFIEDNGKASVPVGTGTSGASRDAAATGAKPKKYKVFSESSTRFL
jgi:hypothetical protein